MNNYFTAEVSGGLAIVKGVNMVRLLTENNMKYVVWGEAAERLYSYEKTGLSPEEVTALKQDNERIRQESISHETYKNLIAENEKLTVEIKKLTAENKIIETELASCVTDEKPYKAMIKACIPKDTDGGKKAVCVECDGSFMECTALLAAAVLSVSDSSKIPPISILMAIDAAANGVTEDRRNRQDISAIFGNEDDDE